MQKAMSTMDGIIDTVSAPHALMPLFSLLKPNGKLVVVGAPNKPVELDILFLVMGKSLHSELNVYFSFLIYKNVQKKSKHSILNRNM